MILRLAADPQIENLRNYPAGVVDRLRKVLLAGAEAKPDPNRAGFYDLLDGSRTFYVHVSPITGQVMLLATWAAESAAGTAPRPAACDLAPCSAPVR